MAGLTLGPMGTGPKRELLPGTGRSGGMSIVTFHNIVSDREYDALDSHLYTRMSVSSFTNAVRDLSREHRFIGLKELVRSAEKGTPVENALAFTFDDAYYGVFRYALPLLKRYGTTATVFPVTSYPSDPARKCFSFDRMEIAFRLCKSRQLDLTGTGIAEGVSKFGSERETAILLRSVKGPLKLMEKERAVALTEEVFRRLGVTNEQITSYASLYDKYLPMGWEDLSEAARSGNEIGSHTTEHLSLAHQSEDVVRTELACSLEEIRRHIPGQERIPFSYPYGGVINISKKVADMVMGTGYSCGVTTLPGDVYPGDDQYILKRREYENGGLV